jgi:MtN3 and saliva related transmembrane protein
MNHIPTTDLLGYIAAVCTTTSFLPQLLHVWRSRSARDISLTTFIVFCLGIVIWLVYGFRVHSLPIILTNAITGLISLGILILKIKFGLATPPPASRPRN